METISLPEYLTLTASGINGSAYVTVSLDEEKLYISQIDYTVKKDKKTQKITYHPDSDTYDLN